ncbi:LON peptidase substrate-binding domain-containing protein [Bartonella tamiae]|uniref:Lon N-terminal domain-containing protein n=1 Tax=Bartonella tamiae Th239 TaxID=1094558 RepID=J0ZLQ7_9HYPH|nr:LON peptidase substrate-binding domain-containing protein [Bartonella tamiae]EJF89358.1 hypothetical protein ME5_01909 [Bartonella tamiae Th239]EJF92777.1 hypothetical protein MEG_01947 [Bartonella tamiae Th307]
MKSGNAHYNSVTDLPEEIALFPLEGVVLLPGGYLPLTVFEPRYLEMVEDVMSHNKLIGIIQPLEENTIDEQKPQLFATGCIGRITTYSENGDGRLLIGLQGVCRFQLLKERDTQKSYRIAKILPEIYDLFDRENGDDINREELLSTFEEFLHANQLDADWDSITEAPTQTLVNALSIIAPFGAAEKQALLEAPDVKTRAQTLIALTERSLMVQNGDDIALN